MPRMSSPPACLASMARMPSSVSIAERANSSSPVGERECQRVENQRLRRQTILVDHDVVDLRAASSLRAAVFAMPSSSIVIATTAAPCAMASGMTESILSRPFSMLIGLTMARPGYCSRASLRTSASVESSSERRSDVQRQLFHQRAQHLPLVVRSVIATQTSSACAPPLRPGRRRPHHPVIVVGQRQTLDFARAERIDPLADDQRRRVLPQVDRADHHAVSGNGRRRARGADAGASLRTSTARCSGSCRSSPRRYRPRTARPSRADRAPFRRVQRDRPQAVDIQRQSGVGDDCHRPRRVLAEISRGLAHVLRPVEQFKPTTSTGSASRSPARRRCRCPAASARSGQA